MTITSPHIAHYWVVPNRILFLDTGKHADLATVQAMDTLLIAYLDASTDPLHIIVDTSKLTEFPTDLRILAESVRFTRHPNLGWRVVVGANKVVEFLARVTSKMSGTSRLHFANTVEEALSFIHEVDTTVPKPDGNATS